MQPSLVGAAFCAIDTPVTALVVGIFSATYVLIAVRRLRLVPIGRPAGALVGAVLMVAVGALTPAQSYAAIDGDTLLLLFGTMALTVYLDRAHFFAVLAEVLLKRCRTGFGLLATLALASGLLSALLVNDTVCVFMTPLVIAACQRARLPLGPYLIALPTSANVGSAASLVGNPQNMIIGSMSGYGFGDFMLHAGPAAIAGLLVNVALLYVFYGRHLPRELPPPVNAPAVTRGARLGWVVAVSLLVVVGYFAGLHMGYTTLAGVALLILGERAEPREVFARVDWSLLLFFAALFVVVAALERTGLIAAVWQHASAYMGLDTVGGAAAFTGLLAALANLVSNVPAVLLAGPYLSQQGAAPLGWVLLSYVTTVAGNLTLVGSVANLIVAERAKHVYGLGFVEYLRFGAAATVATLLVGVPVIYLTFAL